MPKLLPRSPRLRPGEDKLYSQLVSEYNADLKAACGKDKITAPDFMAWLGCGRTTAYKNLKGVRHVGGTRYYATIDIARKLAEDSMRNST